MAGKKPLFAGLGSPAIAHDELAASAGFVTFDVPERDFPRDRSPPHWKFVWRPKRKICAPKAKWHAFGDNTPLTALLSKATALQQSTRISACDALVLGVLTALCARHSLPAERLCRNAVLWKSQSADDFGGAWCRH